MTDLSMYSTANSAKARAGNAYKGQMRRAYALRLREAGYSYADMAQLLETSNLGARLLVHHARKDRGLETGYGDRVRQTP